MKELIQNLINDCGLESKELRFKGSSFIIAHYSEIQKSDFFLFQFGSVSELREKVEADLKKFEYELNSLVVNIRDELLVEYKSRFIDKNLSLIIVAENDDGSEDINWMYKSEQNYNQSRKYILTYSREALQELNQRMQEVDKTLVLSLTELISRNSNKLKGYSGEPWFFLLTKIFMKVPFLNYQVAEDEKQVIEDIDKSIILQLDELNLKDVYESIKSHDLDLDISCFVENITKEN